MVKSNLSWLSIVSFLLALFGSTQSIGVDHFNRPYPFISKEIEKTTEAGAVVFDGHVIYPNIQWLRVSFDMQKTIFKPGYALRIISSRDGFSQLFPSKESLQEWNGNSAYFNGEEVSVQWIVSDPSQISQEKSSDPSFTIIELITSDVKARGQGQETLCGTVDKRQQSSQPNVGRILPMKCTGWIINDDMKCMLTAGHCQGFHDRAVIQFNVPKSTSDGVMQHPAPKDQYPIDPQSVQGSPQGQNIDGADWMYFGAFPQPDTQATAYDRQQVAYDLFDKSDITSKRVKVIGYGVSRASALSRTQKFHEAEFGGITEGRNGNLVLTYGVDTTAGDSGSPIVDIETGKAIGIHTNGGCSSWGGMNSGTMLNLKALQAALQNPQGVCQRRG